MNKEIQELALQTSDVAAITPKVIADVIEEIARHKRIWAQFFKDNRDLERNGGSEVVFPKKGSGVTATFPVSAGTGISASNMTYSAVTIDIKKGGLGLAFQGEAIRQANRDVIRDHIEEAGEVWADTLDIVAFEAMFPSTTVSASGASTINLGSTLPIAFKSINGTDGTLYVSSTSASSIVLADGATIAFYYVPTSSPAGTIGSKRVSITGGSLSAKDLLLLRNDIIAKKRNPDVFVIHPDLLTDILYDPAVKFLEKSAYEGEGPIFNGEIGQLWGMKVIVSNKAPKYGAVALQSDKVGYHIIRKPLQLTRDDYTGMSMDVLYYWGFAEENYGVVNMDAYGAVALKGTFDLSELEVQD